jgi:hypothetical protein
MFTSALRADQYLDAQIKCVVGALNLLESQLATALVAVRRGWWLNKGTHERLTYSLTHSCGTAPVLGVGVPIQNSESQGNSGVFRHSEFREGGLDRSVAINGPPDRACQGLVSDPASVSVSGAVGSLLSPW